MNVAPPQMDLGCKQVSPKRLAWIMDVGESTVADWLKNGEIDHFKKGRLIRIAPEAVLAFVFSYTTRGRGSASRGGYAAKPAQPDQMELLWGRIERLIKDQVAAQMEQRSEMEEAA